MLHASRRPSHPASVLREGVLRVRRAHWVLLESFRGTRLPEITVLVSNIRISHGQLILCHKEEKIIIALIPSKSGPEFRFNLLYLN